MKRFSLIIFAIISIAFKSYCQSNAFFIGDKAYPCTKTLMIGKVGRSLDILFAKKADGSGLIALSDRSNKIIGLLIIYLDDKTIIKCTDRKIYDKVNGTYTTVYFLTASEINKLKKSNIQIIRYNIRSEVTWPDGNGVEAESVSNLPYDEFSSSGIDHFERDDIPSLISALFE